MGDFLNDLGGKNLKLGSRRRSTRIPSTKSPSLAVGVDLSTISQAVLSLG